MTVSAWFVYVLHCADGSLYTGVSTDVNRRLLDHNAGSGAAYTRTRLPVELLWSEPAADRSAALKRELQIKKLTRQQKLELVGGTEA